MNTFHQIRAYNLSCTFVKLGGMAAISGGALESSTVYQVWNKLVTINESFRMLPVSKHAGSGVIEALMIDKFNTTFNY